MEKTKFENWSNQKLRGSLEKWARCERKVSVVVIEHVAEAIARGSFIEWGYPSIKEYMIKELKYSETAANRRVAAAYATIQIPELKQEIEAGALNLTQIAQVQSAIRQEQKTNGQVPVSEKRELFDELLGKNGVETQKILDRKFEFAPVFFAEKHKHDDSVEVTVRMPKDLYSKFLRIKELCSHQIADGNWIEIMEVVADDSLSRRDPLKKKRVELKPSAKPVSSLSVSEVPSQDAKRTRGATVPVTLYDSDINSKSDKHRRSTAADSKSSDAEIERTNSSSLRGVAERKAIRPSVRRFVFQRDQFCQHKNVDGTICGRRHQLEIDHIRPRFAGGGNEVENLRILCKAHNIHRYRLGK